MNTVRLEANIQNKRDLECCVYETCSVSKVPYAIKIKYEVITVLNVADPIHTT